MVTLLIQGKAIRYKRYTLQDQPIKIDEPETNYTDYKKRDISLLKMQTSSIHSLAGLSTLELALRLT